MNKLELLAVLEAAGVEGYSMADPKADLEDAVASIGQWSHPKPDDWQGYPHRNPRVCWCGRLRGHPIV